MTNPADERPQQTPPPPAKEAPFSGATVVDKESREFMTHAYATYAHLRSVGPVVRVPVGRGIVDRAKADASGPASAASEQYFVARYEAVTAALLDPRLSSNVLRAMPPEQRARMESSMPEELRPILHTLLVLDPPDHTRLRKLVQPSFTTRAIEALRPRLQRVTEELLARMEHEAAARGETTPERQVDMIEAFAYPLSLSTISDLLGIPDEDRPTIHGWTERLLRAKGLEGMLDPQTRAGMNSFARYLEELFERKRRAPTEDMISRMVQVQEDGDLLSAEELLSTVFSLYLGGHLPSVHLVGNGVVSLLSHPEQHARFLADPAANAKGMMEETLRYLGPVDYLGGPRVATAELEVEGTRLPQGAQVMMGLASANRDPERFSHPDTFDISRPDAHRHLAFGKGIHICLGAPLARLQGEVAFQLLFPRWPRMRLAQPMEQLELSMGSGMRGFKRIPVSF